MPDFSDPVATTFAISLEATGTFSLAAWVFRPQRVSQRLPSVWLLAMPGGSYRGQAYYDRQVPGYGRTTYSMARYLAQQGIGVVVIDHPGTGSSAAPVHGKALTRFVFAEAYHQLATVLRDHLTEGTLLPDIPTVPLGHLWLAGMGHSMGGYLLTQTQGQYAPFDAAIILGWTNHVHGMLLDAPDREMQAVFTEQDGMLFLNRPLLRPFFYSPCVPQQLIALDEAEAIGVPAGLSDIVVPGVVSDMAAQIRTPVYLGYGAVDMPRRPCEEPAAYPLASSISLFVQSEASHCANFAASRFTLWNDLVAWCQLRAMQRKGNDLSLFHLLQMVTAVAEADVLRSATEPLTQRKQ